METNKTKMLTEEEAIALENSLPELKTFLDDWMLKMQSVMIITKSDFVSGFFVVIERFIKKEIEENKENKEYLNRLLVFQEQNTGQNLWNVSGGLWPKYWDRLTSR